MSEEGRVQRNNEHFIPNRLPEVEDEEASGDKGTQGNDDPLQPDDRGDTEDLVENLAEV